MAKKRNPFHVAAKMLLPYSAAVSASDVHRAYTCCVVARADGVDTDTVPYTDSGLAQQYREAFDFRNLSFDHWLDEQNAYNERLIALGFAAAMYETGDL